MLPPRTEAAARRPLQISLAVLTLGGFLLRAAALGAKELRGDEAFAAVFSAQSLGAIWTGLGQSEPHPPLYYLLLHAMLALAGPSNMSLRYLSLWFGTLAIPALAVAAWRVFGPRAALLTALLTVVNPLLVWQAQDARMYAQLVGFSALALAGASAALPAGRPVAFRRAAPFASACGGAAGALLTHFYGMFIVGGLIGGLVLAGWRSPLNDRRRAYRLAQVLALEIALLAAPLLYHGRSALRGHPPFAPLGLDALLASIGQTLAGGFTTPIPLRLPAAGVAILLAGAGLAVARQRHAGAALLVGMSGLAPLAGLAALEAAYPAYQPAYVAIVAPAWLLAVGALAAPRRPWTWLGAVSACLLLGILAGQSLTTYAASQKNLSFRLAARLLQHDGRLGDAVITNYPDPTLGWVYTHQDDGSLPVLLEPAAMPVDPAALDRRLTDLGERFDRVWFWTLRTAGWDNQHATELWLDRHALPLATEQAGTVQFRLFETPRGFLAHTAPLPAVTFGGRLRVRGASWSAAGGSAGSTLDVTLCWQAVTAPLADYTAFVHLDYGTTLVGQDDHPPVNGLNPTHTWQPGESFLDQYHIPIPAGTAPGVYVLRVGFYAPATLQRLPLQDAGGATVGDALTVGDVTVR